MKHPILLCVLPVIVIVILGILFRPNHKPSVKEVLMGPQDRKEKDLICRHIDEVKYLDISECDKIEGPEKNVYITHDLKCLIMIDEYSRKPRFCINQHNRNWTATTEPQGN